MGTLVGGIAVATGANIIINFIRIIFFIFDAFIYSLPGGAYRAAMYLIDLNKFMETSEILSRFADLIYSFLAIFMFFKVAFSLLTMIVDPAQIEDKQKGASKLIQNIFICLALIVAVPAIFNGARTIQNTIVQDEIIEKAIFGEGFKGNGKYTNVGHKLAIASWSLFIHPNDTLNENATAKAKWEEAFNIDNAARSWGVMGDLFNQINDKSISGRYHIAYMWGISTIFGIYLTWTFIKLAIDVAYRSMKLFILQLISPIAIISFIDPKSGKDGIFAKWTKECIKTYISLFVRIIIYAIASVVIVEFTKNMNADAEIFDGDGFVKVVYLLAILALIKSGPKIFDNIFGTELSKDSETKFVTDMMRGAVGAVGTAAIGGIAGAVAVGPNGNKLGGAWQGIKSGFSKGYNSAKKGSPIDAFKSARSAVLAEDARKYYGIASFEDLRKKQKETDEAVQYSDIYDGAATEALNKFSMAPDSEYAKLVSQSRTAKNGATFDYSKIKDLEGAKYAGKKREKDIAGIVALKESGRLTEQEANLEIEKIEADFDKTMTALNLAVATQEKKVAYDNMQNANIANAQAYYSLNPSAIADIVALSEKSIEDGGITKEEANARILSKYKTELESIYTEKDNEEDIAKAISDQHSGTADKKKAKIEEAKEINPHYKTAMEKFSKGQRARGRDK